MGPPRIDGARSASLWLGGVMALAVLAMQVVPVLAPAIARTSGLPSSFVGLWTGALWLAALLGTVVAPALLARRSAWAIAQSCLIACAAGVGCIATAHPAGLVAGALLIGLGQGLEGPTASHLLAAHVSPQRQALWFSVKQAGVQIGALLASVSLPAVALASGWRGAAALAGSLALVYALALRLPARRLAAARAPSADSRWSTTFATLRRDPVLRWLALTAAAFGMVQVALNGFFVTYAVDERRATLVEAGAWLGAAQFGGLAGRLLWGWVAGRLDAIAPLVLALGLVMAGCSAVLGAAGPSWWLLVSFGLSASGWNGIFLAEVARQVPATQAGAATASVLIVMTLGLAAGPLAFSALGSMLSYSVAFVAWGGVALAGCAALLRARSLRSRRR